MTKEDIKYIEDYLEWVRQNMNPAEVDFEHFANGMMNCNNILSQALSLHNVVGQSGQLPTLIEIDFDGHLKCQVETTDIKPKILKAVNGYGQSVDCREGKIKISEV